MDSLIAAAARALAAGDALGALKRVALRDDPPALALRGIAMAQLGEHPRARELLRRAARGFGAHEELARARCVVAEAEVALAMRDLARLAAHAGGRGGHARGARRSRQRAAGAADRGAPAAAARPPRRGRSRAGPPRRARPAAVAAGGGRAGRGRGGAALAAHGAGAGGARPRARGGRTRARAGAAGRGGRGARRARSSRRAAPRTPATSSRCASTRSKRSSPRARWWSTPAVAACAPAPPGGRWRAGRCCSRWRARSPRRGPATSIGDALIARAFRTRRPDETHRARLRVEIGRLRALVAPLARIEASARGFALTPRGERDVVVLVPPIDGDQASLLALLADGAAWSTSALALALGRQPAHGPARARRARGRRPRALDRARARAALAGAAAGRIHDDLVTPCCAAAWVDWLLRRRSEARRQGARR